jgi:hypothetical protein
MNGRPRLLAALKWVGTTAQIVGVFALAGRVVPPFVAFGVMEVGSVAWLIAGGIMRDRSIIALYLAFTVSNVLGLCRWWHS